MQNITHVYHPSFDYASDDVDPLYDVVKHDDGSVTIYSNVTKQTLPQVPQDFRKAVKMAVGLAAAQ